MPGCGPVRGRWAPSPSGALHLGNARTALVVWLSVRSQGGQLVWRVEDLDAPRLVVEQIDAQQRDLVWLGLDWDEGPELGGAHGPYLQSQRLGLYEEALRTLDAAGRIFPCALSRRELEGIASAPHGREASPYPPSLRPSVLQSGWLDAVLSRQGEDRDRMAVRFRVAPGEVAWDDLHAGRRSERVNEAVGDFVLLRRDGVWAYQLAVVVDDLLMGISEVVRGLDLIDSTARQIQLLQALGGGPPSGTLRSYGHVPLMVNASGAKLSKRDGSLTLEALGAAGLAPEVLVGYLACSLGLIERVEPCRPDDLVGLFTWDGLRSGEIMVPEDLPLRLRSGTLPGLP